MVRLYIDTSRRPGWIDLKDASCSKSKANLDSNYSLLLPAILVKGSLGNTVVFRALEIAAVFRNFFSKKTLPLSGAPAVRRQKSYSAQSGYVYQYFYEGSRAFSRDEESGSEFVFTFSADRKTSHPVSILVSDAALGAWEQSHARLSGTERYAIAKMALFQAFDERTTPELMKQDVRVRAADVAGILETLGLE